MEQKKWGDKRWKSKYMVVSISNLRRTMQVKLDRARSWLYNACPFVDFNILPYKLN